MNIKYYVLLLLITPLICVSAKSQHEVDSVIQVYSPNAFTCRVTDWPNVGAVRLRVTLKGLDTSSLTNKNQAVKFMTEYLKQAKSIKLTNIEPGSYFRVKADVEVDGNNLSEQLIRLGMARQAVVLDDNKITEKMTTKKEIISPDIQKRKVELLKKNLGLTARQDTQNAYQPKKKYVKMSELMNTVVDLSAWNEDTQLDEALQILSDSTNPRLPIVIMWKDLNENSFIDKTTPIGLGGVSSIPVKKALQLLMLSVGRGPGNIEYVSQDGIITIASASMGLSRRMVTRIYDTSEITAPLGQVLSGMGMGTNTGGMGSYGMGGMGGMGGFGMGNMGGMGSMGGFGNSGMNFGSGGFGIGNRYGR